MRLSTSLCLSLTLIGLCSGCAMTRNPFAAQVDSVDATRDRMAAEMRARVERGDVDGARQVLAELEASEHQDAERVRSNIQLAGHTDNAAQRSPKVEAQIEELAALLAAPSERAAKRAELRQYPESQINQMLASYQGVERAGQRNLTPWQQKRPGVADPAISPGQDPQDAALARTGESERSPRQPNVASQLGSQAPWDESEPGSAPRLPDHPARPEDGPNGDQREPLTNRQLTLDADDSAPRTGQRSFDFGENPALDPRNPFHSLNDRDSRAGLDARPGLDARDNADSRSDMNRDPGGKPESELRQVSDSRFAEFPDRDRSGLRTGLDAPDPRHSSQAASLTNPFLRGGIPEAAPSPSNDPRSASDLPLIRPAGSADPAQEYAARPRGGLQFSPGLDPASGSTQLGGDSSLPRDPVSGNPLAATPVSGNPLPANRTTADAEPPLLNRDSRSESSLGNVPREMLGTAQRELSGTFQKVRNTIGLGSDAAAAPAVQQSVTVEALIFETERKLAQTAPGETEAEQLDYLRRHVDLRMLYLMSGQVDRALEPIPRVHGADQEFWQKTLWALSNYFDKQGIPQASARATETIDQLNVAIARLRQKADLKLQNVAFCSRILSFGNYERFDEDAFDPGQAVLLYAEIENFRSVRAEGDQYRTAVESSAEIYRTDGREPQLVETIPFDVTEDYCRNHRRDYFQSYQFPIPASLPAGNYVLVLRAIDQLSRKVATARVNFRVHTDLR